MNARQRTELLADVEVLIHRGRVEAADGWIVVTLDDANPGDPVNASGPLDTPEAAMVEQQRLYTVEADSYTHVVVPLYSPPEETA